MKKKRRLGAERLEARQLMAGDIGVTDGGGTLNVIGTNGDDVIIVDQIRNTRSVVVNKNGVSVQYDDVQRLRIATGNGNDDISIHTFDDADFLIGSFVDAGNGDDIIQGGGGSDVLVGGNGDDVITAFVTDENYNPIGRGSRNVLIGGNGNDSLWGGWGVQDVILGGNGDDLIYDIVGGRNTIDGGKGNDFIVARDGVGLPTDPLNNPGVLTSDSVVEDARDKRVVGFDAATQAAGPIRIGSTLYVLNLDGGDILVDRDGADLVVNYDGDEFRFNSRGITAIAGIGGPTDDSFINNTDISSVFYGQGGNDVLLGSSSTDLLKGGNGDDVIDGRDGQDDITGDAGSDVLLAQDGQDDVVRTDALDSVFADLARDRLVVKKNLAFS